jgi:alanyl-tRNA synthetase
MTAKELKKKYFSFFVKKGHKKLPNASLVPENDPTALFINAGMHPLVPYLLGEEHPLGKRLVGNQRCLRTQDIDNVGNIMHLTFFEMLGNWSLGDYWKKEAIEWSWEFLTKELGFEPQRISVTCFAGDKNTPRDEEAAKAWWKVGVPKGRIYFLGKEDNWWAVGKTGPCGSDTEMFYDTGKKKCGPNCRPGDNCGKYFEVWNNVFMEFNRLPNGKLEKLKQQNIDTGMGVERTTTMLQEKDDVYETELFTPLIKEIEEVSKKKYQGKNKKSMRIIVDHIRAATFAIADGVIPSNVEAGYVVRRLVRRAIRHGRFLEIKKSFLSNIARTVIDEYGSEYSCLKKDRAQIINKLDTEEKRFGKTLERGLREFNKLAFQKEIRKNGVISGKVAFKLYETYGFPLELTKELASEKKLKVDEAGFKKAEKEHQQKSRASLEKKFAGGLADHSESVTKLHTATHLLHQALRDVLGENVRQVGSNITPERLRFDFTHPKKLTDKEMKKIEEIINEKVKADLKVKMEIMTLIEARKKGILAFFGEKYEEKVKVYSIENYSKEVCGGPHAESTGKLGNVKIVREKAIGAGRRRIYAQLAHGS